MRYSDRPPPLLRRIDNKPTRCTDDKSRKTDQDSEQASGPSDKNVKGTTQKKPRTERDPISDVEISRSRRSADDLMNNSSSDASDVGSNRADRGNMSKTNWNSSFRFASSKDAKPRRAESRSNQEERQSSTRTKPLEGPDSAGPSPTKKRKLSAEPRDADRGDRKFNRAAGAESSSQATEPSSSGSHLVDEHGFARRASTKSGYGKKPTYGSQTDKKKGKPRAKDTSKGALILSAAPSQH